MPNTFAYIVLFGWPLVVIQLFRSLPKAEALCWSIIGGYLFLPFGVGINLPVVPTLEKGLIPALSAALVVLMFSRAPSGRRGAAPSAEAAQTGPQAGAAPSPGRGFARARSAAAVAAAAQVWTRLPLPRIFLVLMVVMVGSAFLIVLTNDDSLKAGPRVLPPLSLYDGFSMAQTAFLTLLPFLLGQAVLGEVPGQRALLGVLAIGGLIYSFPVLFEVRFSPQISRWVYGFLSQSFIQAMRGTGFRPVVFLQHGLWLALYMAMAAFAALALVKGAGMNRGRVAFLAVWLTGVLFLCNSLGAFLIFAALAPLLFFSLRAQLATAAALSAVLLLYPMLRGAQLVPAAGIEQAVGMLSADRAASLGFRLRNEEVLLVQANKKPIFGWGGYGRSRVYDPKTGRDITITDGHWVIIMGTSGWVGYLATYGLLGGPVLLLFARRRQLALTPETPALALILVANLTDSIANATLTPITWLVAGALAGRLRFQPAGAGVPRSDAARGRSLRTRDAAGRGRGPEESRGPGRAGGALRNGGVALVLAALSLCAFSLAPQPLRAQAAAPAGLGLSNPTLAFGLSSVSDWSPSLPFLDLMKMSRPFVGSTLNSYGAMKQAALIEGGWLDAEGWPTGIPPGMKSVGTLWDWSSSKTDPVLAATRAGVYVLHYEGKGTLQLTGDVKILSQADGEIILQNTNGGSMALNILATDAADPIHDITLVRQEYQALFDMGEVFNPDWLAIVQDARQLRFMDWMETNNTVGTTWDARPAVSDVSWSSRGVPVEIMVQLANQTGSDPWFNMPVGASEEYIRNFATYVRDHLKPGLVAHVEYGNENWNSAFSHVQWLVSEAQRVWGTASGDSGAGLDYGAMLATKSALIWDEVFGAAAEVRVDNVMGTQTSNAWIANRLMGAWTWARVDPEHYVAPSSVFDSLGVTTYFGGEVITKTALRQELLAKIAEGYDVAAAWLNDQLDTTLLPKIASYLAANKAVADKYGLDLVSYEGGQHLLHSFAVRGVTEADLAVLTEFMSAYVRSDDMAAAYASMWQAWASVSDGPFMQFGEVGLATKWGAWGLYSSLDDENPRAALLESLNAAQAAWFGTGGVQYQQGAIRIATAAGGTLTGTGLDDWLVGGKGNDRFDARKGDDVIAGGGGLDTLLLAERPEAYVFTREGDLWRATGHDSSYLFSGIEILRFSNGSLRFMDQYIGQIATTGTKALALPAQGGQVEAAATGIVTLTAGAGQDGVMLQSIAANSALGRALGLTSDTAYYTGTANAQTVAEVLAQGSLILGPKMIRATTGDDIFQGRGGNDTVFGLGGDDRLVGRGGNDQLDGGFGQDTLNGGIGDDLLRGGAGADSFIFGPGGGHDVIADFTPRDLLDLTNWHLGTSLGSGLSTSGTGGLPSDWTQLATSDAEGNLVLDFGGATLTFEGLQIGDTTWMHVLI